MTGPLQGLTQFLLGAVMATSTVVFVALHGETFIFWLWQSKNSTPVGEQLSPSAQVLILSKTHVMW